MTLRPNVVLSTISISLSDLQTIRSVTGVKSATVQATDERGQGNRPAMKGHKLSLLLKSCFQTPQLPRGQGDLVESMRSRDTPRSGPLDVDGQAAAAESRGATMSSAVWCSR